MICCYILYSPTLNRFYIGATQDGIKNRIEKHNSGFYGKSHYTTIANDWRLYIILETKDYSHAIRIENHIKKMKSSKYIQNLNQYPEMRLKLYERTLSI